MKILRVIHKFTDFLTYKNKFRGDSKKSGVMTKTIASIGLPLGPWIIGTTRPDISFLASFLKKKHIYLHDFEKTVFE